MYSLDPPEDDSMHDPDRCDCGAELMMYTEEPAGQCERVCPRCDVGIDSLAPCDPAMPRGGFSDGADPFEPPPGAQECEEVRDG